MKRNEIAYKSAWWEPSFSFVGSPLLSPPNAFAVGYYLTVL
jgi:hypothetical protein